MQSRKGAPNKYWFLEGKLNDGNTVLIKIDTFPFVVGRNKKCSLSISSQAVSRQHSVIFMDGDRLAVRDLKSMNGTFVNTSRIAENAFLRDDDIISFADQQFRVFSADNQTGEYSRTTDHLRGPLKQRSFAEKYRLSKREEEILFQLLRGKSTKDIGKKLYISEGTAKNHILKIYEKTDAHSRYKLMDLYAKFPTLKIKK